LINDPAIKEFFLGGTITDTSKELNA